MENLWLATCTLVTLANLLNLVQPVQHQQPRHSEQEAEGPLKQNHRLAPPNQDQGNAEDQNKKSGHEQNEPLIGVFLFTHIFISLLTVPTEPSDHLGQQPPTDN